MTKNTSGDGFEGKAFLNDPMKYMASLTKMQGQFFETLASSFTVPKAPTDAAPHGDGLSVGAKEDNPSPPSNEFVGIKALWDSWANVSNWSHISTAEKPFRQDRRFKHEIWENHPFYFGLLQFYHHCREQAYNWLNQQEGITTHDKEALRFQLEQFFDASSPSNFILSNPEIMEKAIATNGASLQKGLENAMRDFSKGQLTHTDTDAFELGVNIAITPGKVVHETPLYQLIQYEPVTKDQLEAPLVIFPPWINRYYILDLNAKKSFVKWALEQGIAVFMVSWKSADSNMADVIWDDYVKAEIDAIDTIRTGLNVDAVHTVGYCVAGTTLNAALALLHARGEQHKVKSATFFTTQVDFEDAGDLKAFTSEAHVKLLDIISSDGYLDGRVMAIVFNLLRSKDLIWNYVVDNYLLGNDYPAFDLLHWNGDTANLPAAWHKSYINDLYRENLLVIPNRLEIDGTPIDLRLIKTPAYIQAGIEDHIAPAKSVWKLCDHLSGPVHFILAGSGHIAGVVNHPDAQKYQYWRNDSKQLSSLDDFVNGAKETKGSWWPDWALWLRDQDNKMVEAYIPGKGSLQVIEDAPGRYVRLR